MINIFKNQKEANAAFENAVKIMVDAHSGQPRLNGEPYILHPLRIASKFKKMEFKIVAILHDVVEDSPEIDFDTLILDLNVHAELVDALRFLTRERDQDYEEYIRMIDESPEEINELVRAVKIQDLIDNMDIIEMPKMKQKDFDRFVKYKKAFKFLNRD